jgi:hypothetical protein
MIRFRDETLRKHTEPADTPPIIFDRWSPSLETLMTEPRIVFDTSVATVEMPGGEFHPTQAVVPGFIDSGWRERGAQPFVDENGNSVLNYIDSTGTWVTKPSPFPAAVSQEQWHGIRSLCKWHWMLPLTWKHLRASGREVGVPNGIGDMLVKGADGWGECPLPIHSIRIRYPEEEAVEALLKVRRSFDKAIMGVDAPFQAYCGSSYGYCNHPERRTVAILRPTEATPDPVEDCVLYQTYTPGRSFKEAREESQKIIQSHLQSMGDITPMRVYYGAGYNPPESQYSPSLSDWDAVAVSMECVRLQIAAEPMLLHWEQIPKVHGPKPFLVLASAALQFHEERVAAGGIIHFKAVD